MIYKGNTQVNAILKDGTEFEEQLGAKTIMFDNLSAEYIKQVAANEKLLSDYEGAVSDASTYRAKAEAYDAKDHELTVKTNQYNTLLAEFEAYKETHSGSTDTDVYKMLCNHSLIAGDFVIPERFDTRLENTQIIDPYAFYGSYVTSVTFPSPFYGQLKISDYAFANC